MPVTFDNAVVYDHGRPTDIETLFRVYGNWGSLHDFDFDDSYLNASIPLSGTDWSGRSLFAVELKDVLLHYTVNDLGHGGVFRYVGGVGLLFGINTANQLVAYELDGGSKTLLLNRPVVAPAAGQVLIAYRLQRFSSDESDLWETASMWINDALIGTFVHYLGTAINEATNVGVAAQTNLTITNIRIPQLTAFSEWASIDPGEPAMGGLERSIEGRYVKYFVRWNGALRAWRSQPTEPAHTYSDAEEVYMGKRVYDPRQLYTHIRMLGAFTQAEFVRGDLIGEREHRFKEVNNPYIMSNTECFEEAEREIIRLEEMSLMEPLEAPCRPLLEPEDHIVTADGHRIITRRDWDFTQTTIDESLDCRKYAYDTSEPD